MLWVAAKFCTPKKRGGWPVRDRILSPTAPHTKHYYRGEGMKYYKTTGVGGRGIYSNFVWSLPTEKGPGEWMPEVETLNPCVSGYHLVSREHLIEWLGPEIYEAEGGGSCVKCEDKIVFSRARLTTRLNNWNSRTTALFSLDCAERVRHLNKHPEDQNLLIATRNFLRGDCSLKDLNSTWAVAAATETAGSTETAAEAAARAATWAASRAATWAASRAATETAGSTETAAEAADRTSAAAEAATWAADRAAAEAADGAYGRESAGAYAWEATRAAAEAAARTSAAGTMREERMWQIDRLFQYLEGKVG